VTLGVEERDIPLVPVTSYEAVSGQGAVGVVDGKTVVAGKAKLMADRGLVIPERYETAFAQVASVGHTTFYAGWNGEVKGVIGVADTLRETAKSAVSRLGADGVKTVMLTGDSELAAKAIAAEVGIATVVAEVLPDEKAAEVERLIDSGMTVAFVGDGINDARHWQ
jgi:P-type Cu+ transporter